MAGPAAERLMTGKSIPEVIGRNCRDFRQAIEYVGEDRLPETYRIAEALVDRFWADVSAVATALLHSEWHTLLGDQVAELLRVRKASMSTFVVVRHAGGDPRRVGQDLKKFTDEGPAVAWARSRGEKLSVWQRSDRVTEGGMTLDAGRLVVTVPGPVRCNNAREMMVGSRVSEARSERVTEVQPTDTFYVMNGTTALANFPTLVEARSWAIRQTGVMSVLQVSDGKLVRRWPEAHKIPIPMPAASTGGLSLPVSESDSLQRFRQEAALSRQRTAELRATTAEIQRRQQRETLRQNVEDFKNDERAQDALATVVREERAKMRARSEPPAPAPPPKVDTGRWSVADANPVPRWGL
jgi:hypothetical protein